MAIRLVSKSEKFTAEIEGCKFFYRRLPQDENERTRKAHSVRDKLDDDGFSKAVFKYCLLGWEGVEDANGDEAPFSNDAAEFLPPQVVRKLVTTMFGSLAGEEAFDVDPF